MGPLSRTAHRHLTRRFVVVLALTLPATMLLAASPVQAAPAQAATALPSTAPISTAKVKCVNVKSGFARYASNGKCRKSERRDRKPCVRGGSCVVGDIGPGRGKVFYAARTKQPWGRYLEAAPSTWSSRDGDPNIMWCQDVTNVIPGSDATAIGAGAANTAAMLATCTSDAAFAAHAYRGGGRTDWYLPSRDELRRLFLRKDLVGGFIQHGYWSSSQVDATNAWIQDFYADYQPAPSDKSFANYVRPIRAF
jgi:hypothetical protein